MNNNREIELILDLLATVYLLLLFILVKMPEKNYLYPIFLFLALLLTLNFFDYLNSKK